MRILTTQIKPTSGTARVFGLDVVSQASKARRIIGYVPQEISLWTLLRPSNHSNLQHRIK
ncbi:hypothetical protein ACSU1N_05985 [Thermogladius sp. 4427co]|uniref:hypothetical protein n=1 Tax=Thermogladius sp. 4427co TaxID=3450718 RepID=UPI003F79AE27